MSEKLHNLPEVLFRAFDCRSYAEDFVNGKFRLGSLAHYRNIPDESRRDESEGIASYRDYGGVETHSENGNSQETYILCCSTGSVAIDYLRKRMGSYVVKINDPLGLAREIERFLESKNVGTFNGIHGWPVEYNKNEVRRDELDSSENFDLSLRQKYRGDVEDNEYRLFFILKRQESKFVKGNHFYVDLGGPIGFAEIIT